MSKSQKATCHHTVRDQLMFEFLWKHRGPYARSLFGVAEMVALSYNAKAITLNERAAIPEIYDPKLHINVDTAAWIMGKSVRWFWYEVKKGNAPKHFHLNARTYWHKHEVEEWKKKRDRIN